MVSRTLSEFEDLREPNLNFAERTEELRRLENFSYWMPKLKVFVEHFVGKWQVTSATSKRFLASVLYRK